AADDAAVPADHVHGPPGRLRALHHALPGGAAPLLDDDQLVDGRQGHRHAAAASADAGTAEALVADAAERRRGRRQRRETSAAAAEAAEVDGVERPAPGQAQEEAGTAVTSSPEPLRIEATGETLGEAKWLALRELEKLAPGLDKSAVEFEVVAEGERGLLGV